MSPKYLLVLDILFAVFFIYMARFVFMQWRAAYDTSSALYKSWSIRLPWFIRFTKIFSPILLVIFVIKIIWIFKNIFDLVIALF